MIFGQIVRQSDLGGDQIELTHDEKYKRVNSCSHCCLEVSNKRLIIAHMKVTLSVVVGGTCWKLESQLFQNSNASNFSIWCRGLQRRFERVLLVCF